MVVLEGQAIELYATKVQIHRTVMDKVLKDRVKNVAIGYSSGLIVVFNKRTSTIYGSWELVTEDDEPADEKIIHSFFKLERLGQVYKIPVIALELVNDGEDDTY